MKCRKEEKNMDELEKVERLREKADVTYEEAKKALEDSLCQLFLRRQLCME